MIDRLKQIFGSKCTAININGEITEFINVPSVKMKFCEAVSYSFKIPIRLKTENISCQGARRSVGLDSNDQQLAKIISENNNIPVLFIRDIMGKITRLQNVRSINLGYSDSMEKDTKPDLYIIYVQPSIITSIMHKLAKKAICPSIPPFSFLSVCGNVFANCYINQAVSISFGCPESRQHGGIAKNEVALGIPYKIVSDFIRDFET